MLAHSPSIATNGLVFAYDMQNRKKSFKGIPTTNISAGIVVNVYNNVPGDVTATIVQTADTYDGAPVWKLTLTPTTATGVGYLTNGNNPGIGVVTGGGGGTANTYTGHAIYYRPAGPTYVQPLFTNYSNIPGWGAGSLGSNRSVSMGDGWYRGEVIWYDTVTRSDNKYWAINPAGATINVPMIFYWAGPFREDRNDSTMVGQYINGTRSNTQSILDLTGANTVTTNSLTYASDGTFSFDGTSNYTTLSTFANKPTTAITCESWIKPTKASVGTGTHRGGAISSTNSMYIGIIDSTDGGATFSMHWANQTSVSRIYNWNGSIPNNQWSYLVGTYDGTTTRAYLNAVEIWSAAQTGSIPDATYVIGTYGLNLQDGVHNFNGSLPLGKIYNRALSAAEVQQNFNALRGRYGI